jgi:hypothetical protein
VALFGAGQSLTAASLNNAFPNGLIKQADENYNNGTGTGTTLHGDTELNVPILASTNYHVNAHILVIEAAGTGIDLKVAWTQPAGCILDLAVVAPHTAWNASAAALEAEWAAWQAETGTTSASKSYGTTNSASFSYHFRGVLRVGATGGFFRLWWAQVNASVSNLTVKAGSSLVVTPFQS